MIRGASCEMDRRAAVRGPRRIQRVRMRIGFAAHATHRKPRSGRKLHHATSIPPRRSHPDRCRSSVTRIQSWIPAATWPAFPSVVAADPDPRRGRVALPALTRASNDS
jgi:hypothetical protein